LAAEVVLAGFVYAVMMGYVLLRGYEPVIVSATAVAGAGLILYGLTIPFLTTLSAFQDLRRVAVVNFLSSLISAIVIFAAIGFGKYIVFLASSQAIFGAVSLLVYYRFLKKYIPEPRILHIFDHIDWKFLRSILLAALPFALLASFSTIYNRIDVVIITRLLGYSETGLYTAAYKVVDLTNFFPAVVSHSLYPLLTGLMAQRAVSVVRVTLEKYVRYMIAIALPIAVGGSLLARQLVLVLTGGNTDFLASADVLAILVWAIAILFIYITANSLVISQLTRLAVYVTGVNVVINIVGNFLLVPHYGIRGAAIMTVVSEFIQGVFYFYFIRKNITEFSLGKYFIRPVLAAGAMAIVLWFVRGWQPIFVPEAASAYHLLPLIVNAAVPGLISLLVYVGTLFAFGFFGKDDVAFVRKLIGKSA
jgi:O-antigen/teichoic acid export membrane protein